MQPTLSTYKKSISLLTVCLALSGCSTLLSGDEDDTSNIYGTVKMPPRITDPAYRNTTPTTTPISLKRVEPSVAISAPLPASSQVLVPVDLTEQAQAAPAVSANKTATATQQKQAPAPADDVDYVANPMLFAPYIPTLREGQAPKRWQKQPSYDFPWIPGATPTRINEETVVGYGEQMLGRIYAHAAFGDRSGNELAINEPIQVKPLPAGKKGAKNAKSSENSAVSLSSSNLKSLQCDGGATCLDAARDALVEDAKAKGWDMMLSRRVSLHNSFQFSRGERVIWVELNSNGKRDLDIEYTLMPIQSQAKNN